MFKIKPCKYARQLHFIKHASSMYILPILMKTEFNLSRKTSTIRMKDLILQEDTKAYVSSRLVWIDLEVSLDTFLKNCISFSIKLSKASANVLRKSFILVNGF